MPQSTATTETTPDTTDGGPATTSGAGTDAIEAPDTPQDDVAEDLLVEEVSIDGMCGVY